MRGWTHFEQQVSSWIKDRSKCLDLSLLHIPPSAVSDFYQEVECCCASHRSQPRTSYRFREDLESKVFSNGADLGLVSQLYTNCFEEVCHPVCIPNLLHAMLSLCRLPSLSLILNCTDP